MKNCFAKTYRSNSRLCGHCNPPLFTYRSRNPSHNCEEFIDEIYSSRLHLMGIPF